MQAPVRTLRSYERDGIRVVVTTPPTKRGNGKVRTEIERTARGWLVTASATNADPVDGIRVVVEQYFPSRDDATSSSCFLRSIALSELALGRKAA